MAGHCALPLYWKTMSPSRSSLDKLFVFFDCGLTRQANKRTPTDPRRTRVTVEVENRFSLYMMVIVERF
jgi:hypothetical protein